RGPLIREEPRRSTRRTSFAEADAEGAGLLDDLRARIDELRLGHRFGDIDRDDLAAAQGDHLSELAALDELGGGDAVAGGEDAVEARGAAAALDVAEHRHPHVRLDAALERLRDARRRAHQPGHLAERPLADARVAADRHGAL